jgi:hypothetical protein
MLKGRVGRAASPKGPTVGSMRAATPSSWRIRAVAERRIRAAAR